MQHARWWRATSAPRASRSPSNDVNRPPASVMIGTSAAMSYSLTPNSATNSSRPSASSMYGQVSPYPRSRQTARDSRSRASSCPTSSHCRMLWKLALASPIVSTAGHGQPRRRAVGRVRPCAESARGPPAAAERGLAGDADTRHAVDRQRDQGRPHRDALEVVRRAVDRVDDPLALGRAGRPELLAEHAVVRTLGLEDRADRALGGEVGLGHVRRIGLELHVEVGGVETVHGCRVRGIRQPQREREIGLQIALEGRAEGHRSSGGGHVIQPNREVSARFPGDAIVMVTFTLGSPCGGHAPLAQSAEQLTLNQWVLGSSPRGCTMSTYTVATDGACMRNPGPAGWAWVGEDGRWAAGSLEAGTNNIGELLAVLYAIRDNADVENLHIQADSMYAINTYQTWMDAHRPTRLEDQRQGADEERRHPAGADRRARRASGSGSSGRHLRARARTRRTPPQRLGGRARGARIAARQSRSGGDLVDRSRSRAHRRDRRRAEERARTGRSAREAEPRSRNGNELRPEAVPA